jgi:hypothetical protein
VIDTARNAHEEACVRRLIPHLLLAVLTIGALLAVVGSISSRSNYLNAPALEGAHIPMKVEAVACFGKKEKVSSHIIVTPAVQRAILKGKIQVFVDMRSGLIGISTYCGFENYGPSALGYFEVNPGGPWHIATVSNRPWNLSGDPGCVDPSTRQLAIQSGTGDCSHSGLGVLSFGNRAYYNHQTTSLVYDTVPYPNQQWNAVS